MTDAYAIRRRRQRRRHTRGALYELAITLFVVCGGYSAELWMPPELGHPVAMVWAVCAAALILHGAYGWQTGSGISARCSHDET